MQRHKIFFLVSCWLMATACSAQPQVDDSLILLSKTSFTVLYDFTRLCPAVVWWPLSPSDCEGSSRQKSNYFATDMALPAPRARSSWFSRSGYQRGHMCPSADRRSSTERQAETFVMSNVAPMTPFLNQRAWFNLESTARSIVQRRKKAVIVAGCLWSTPPWCSSLVGRICVPDSFFRIVYIPADTAASVYWLIPQSAVIEEERKYRVTREGFRKALQYRYSKFIKSW